MSTLENVQSQTKTSSAWDVLMEKSSDLQLGAVPNTKTKSCSFSETGWAMWEEPWCYNAKGCTVHEQIYQGFNEIHVDALAEYIRIPSHMIKQDVYIFSHPVFGKMICCRDVWDKPGLRGCVLGVGPEGMCILCKHGNFTQFFPITWAFHFSSMSPT